MKHTITEFKEWPKGLEVSYHDWVVKASKTELTKKLGFKPRYNRSGYKWTYMWNCSLDNGRYYFTIYDMSYGRHLGKDQVTEYHIGFNCDYDDIHEFWPNTLEALDMLDALYEMGLYVKHAQLWENMHKDDKLYEIEKLIKQKINNESGEN